MGEVVPVEPSLPQCASVTTKCLAVHNGHHHHLDKALNPCISPRQSWWNVQCQCLFSALPDEMLLFNVFTFLGPMELSALSSVCRRWRFLASDKVLWHTLPLCSRRQNVTDDVYMSLVSRFGPALRNLRLCGCQKITASALTTFPPSLGQLRAIHLCNLKGAVIDEVLFAMAAACPWLEEVSLDGCVKVTDSGASAVISRSKNLRDLSLRGNMLISVEAFRGIQSSLRSLNIGSCSGISREIIPTLTQTSGRTLTKLNLHALKIDDEAVDLLTQGCKQLTSLQLSSSNPFGGSSPLTDATTWSLARLTNLRELSLQGASKITNDGLSHLADHCTALEILDIGGCPLISDAGVEALASRCTSLRHLTIAYNSAVTDRVWHILQERAPLLTRLDVHGCTKLTGPNMLRAFRVPLLISSASAPTAMASLGLPSAATNKHSPSPSCSLSDLSCSLSVSRLDEKEDMDETTDEEPTAPPRPFARLLSLDIATCRNIKPGHVQLLQCARPTLAVTSF